MDNNPEFSAYLKFQVEATLVRVAKESLSILGEIARLNRPLSYAESQQFRKRILDANGESKRELHSCIDKLDINLRKQE